MKREKPKIVRVVKKKGGHAAHHGGSWKVAYADFVTAMMAFFMVMWIVGMDDKTKQAIEGYFTNPVGFTRGYSSGKSPLSSGNSPAQVNTTPMRLISRREQESQFEKLSQRIRESVSAERASLGSLAGQIEVVLGNDGLRIEILEAGSGETCFPLGSAEMKPVATRALAAIGRQLQPLDGPIILEGHTDAAQYGQGTYTNWELSADRANAARRVLVANGIAPDRLVEIRGLADRQLHVPSDPYDPSNRRITILLPFDRHDDSDVLPVPPAPASPKRSPARIGTS